MLRELHRRAKSCVQSHLCACGGGEQESWDWAPCWGCSECVGRNWLLGYRERRKLGRV
jgi:hypothetical protein